MEEKTDKSRKINVKKVNQMISIGNKILKILFILFIFLLVYVTTMIVIEWNIISLFKTLFSIILPLFIGWFIAWLLNPFVKKLMKKGIGKGLSVAIVYTILILFILIVGWFTLASLGNQMSELISSIPKIGNYLTTWIDNFFVKMSNLSLHNLDSMKLAFMNKIESYILGLQTNLPNIAMNVVTTIFSGVGQIAMSFLLAFYISYDFDKVAKSFKNLFPKKAKGEVEYLLDKLNESLYAFVSGTLWLSILLFIVSIIGFSIIGLNASVVVSFVCVITNLIPYIGPYMGAAIAGVLGFVQGPIVGILTLVFILIVQMIEGNVLHPIVMSKKMNLSPITIIISLLIFEHFFGIIGMIIATPAVAIIKIIYVFLDEKYDLFEFMDEED